jgi:2-oxo-4-hydroxy-4-carboxy-5-ureidoimidazoline decarboxylase
MNAASRLQRYSLEEVNGWTREAFTHAIGPAFEHSPWIAAQAWPRRPFSSLSALHGALCETVLAASEEQKLDLIRAHPDLAGRAALTGALTPSSTREQTSAGLNKLTVEEIAAFQQLNDAYRGKFGFPFVICARLNKKQAILNGFRIRLEHSRPEEIRTALEEILKIAWLRLRDTVAETA